MGVSRRWSLRWSWWYFSSRHCILVLRFRVSHCPFIVFEVGEWSLFVSTSHLETQQKHSEHGTYVQFTTTSRKAPKQHSIAPKIPLVEQTKSGVFLNIENFEQGETVYRCCIIGKGWLNTVDDGSANASAAVDTHDCEEIMVATQSWPIGGSRVKIIAMLSPGGNTLAITRTSGSLEGQTLASRSAYFQSDRREGFSVV
ncbi:hypothetical protein LZ30DRAFT_737786 [Colletotrichum cereale]|nr:hypothetical protein LZ30DRAFT_737786 [Colletotrichum cereale]